MKNNTKKIVNLGLIGILLILSLQTININAVNGRGNSFPTKIEQTNRVEVLDNLIASLEGISDNDTKKSMIDDFMAEQTPYGFPVIFNDTIVFVFRGNAPNASVGARIFVDPQPMNHVSGTDFFYRKFTLFNDVGATYWFFYNNTFTYDPLNNGTIVCCGLDYSHVFRMPEYSDDGSHLFDMDVGSTVVSHSFTSSNNNNKYNVRVYLPAGYATDTEKRYKSFYAGDGSGYLDGRQVDKSLNYLDYYNITDPLIGVFIYPEDGANRDPDFFNERQSYGKFIVEELIPFIDSTYRTINNSRSRAHVGYSAGGFFSFYVALEYPDVFNLIGSQSGALGETFSNLTSQSPSNEDLIELYFQNHPKNENFRIYLNAGTFEVNVSNHHLFSDNEGVAKVLAEKDYTAKFRAFHQGHDPFQWRATFAEMLTFLFTDKCSDYSGSPIMYGDIQNPACGSTSTTTTTTTPSTTTTTTTPSTTDGNPESAPGFSLIIVLSILAIGFKRKRIK